MAKEKIISISTGQAVKNIGELRENIKYYKKALDEADLTANEHQAILTRLQENQAALRNAMHATTAEFTDITNAATAANVTFDKNNKLVRAETLSYNELVRELDILKQQWRATTNQAERADLTKRIQAVNDQLKGMDASVGVFGRNVGNYIGAVDHLTAGLSAMGRGASGLVGPLRGVTMGFKTLSATPAVAILGLLANVLTKVTSAVNSAEDSTQGLKEALAPFQAIGDAILKILQGAASVLVSVVGWVGKLTQAIIGNNEAAEKRLALAKEQNALDRDARDRMIQNAKDEQRVAELRAKASERLNYTAKERLAFLQEAGDLENQIAEREAADAQRQYEAIKARNAMSKSTKEDLDEEARAYADSIKAWTHYYQQQRQINQGITRARKELLKEEREEAKAIKDAAKAKLDAEKDYLTQLIQILQDGSKERLALEENVAEIEYQKAVAEAREKIRDTEDLQRTLYLLEAAFLQKRTKIRQDYAAKAREAELLEIRNTMQGYEKGSAEFLDLQVQLREREYDTLTRMQGETDQQFLARRIAAFKALQEARQEFAENDIAATRKGLENEMNALESGSITRFEKAVEIAQYDLDNLHRRIGESEEDFRARQLAAEKAYRDAVYALDEEEATRDGLLIQQRMATLEEGSLEYLALAVELKQHELDTLHQMEGESNEAFRLRELEAEREYSDALKAEWRGRLNVMQQAVAGVSGILGSLADLMENNTELTQEEAEKAKNLRIAGATIDMLQGAVTAFSSAQQLGPIAGPIVGAINAAAVVAAGIANIAKIKATEVSTQGTGSTTASVPAVVSAPTAEPSVRQVRSVTSASEEERLNQMAGEQRVYILDSDLQAADNARRVEVEETTF